MDSLKEYGDLFERLNLTELKVEHGDFKLDLKRETQKVEYIKQESAACDNITNPIPYKSAEEKQEAVKAPLLGIFYLGKKNDKSIEVGDKVEKGDVICSIEAMKMMNEVKSTVSGVVKEICAQDGNLVEYGQSLFIIE